MPGTSLRRGVWHRCGRGRGAEGRNWHCACSRLGIPFLAAVRWRVDVGAPPDGGNLQALKIVKRLPTAFGIGLALVVRLAAAQESPCGSMGEVFDARVPAAEGGLLDAGVEVAFLEADAARVVTEVSFVLGSGAAVDGGAPTAPDRHLRGGGSRAGSLPHRLRAAARGALRRSRRVPARLARRPRLPRPAPSRRAHRSFAVAPPGAAGAARSPDAARRRPAATRASGSRDGRLGVRHRPARAVDGRRRGRALRACRGRGPRCPRPRPHRDLPRRRAGGDPLPGAGATAAAHRRPRAACGARGRPARRRSRRRRCRAALRSRPARSHRRELRRGLHDGHPPRPAGEGAVEGRLPRLRGRHRAAGPALRGARRPVAVGAPADRRLGVDGLAPAGGEIGRPTLPAQPAARRRPRLDRRLSRQRRAPRRLHLRPRPSRGRAARARGAGARPRSTMRWPTRWRASRA